MTLNGDTLDLTGCEPIFFDDFEGDALDDTAWAYRINGEGPYAGGFWTPDNLIVKDGNLIIRTTKRENGVYYSSAVSTLGKRDWLYGYFEVRAILPDAQGLSASFWMLPTRGFSGNTEGGRAGAEIDIMESSVHYTDPARYDDISQNIHVDGYGKELKSCRVADVPGVEPYSRYNTYGLLWTPREYVFYVNRVETARSRFHSGVSTVPEFLLMQVAVNGKNGVHEPGWTGDITKNPESAFPADYVIDYVKVFDLSSLPEKGEQSSGGERTFF
jgi:beta-glucanase (GH16 family)